MYKVHRNIEIRFSYLAALSHGANGRECCHYLSIYMDSSNKALLDLR